MENLRLLRAIALSIQQMASSSPIGSGEGSTILVAPGVEVLNYSHSEVTVNQQSITILAANNSRKHAIIQNKGEVLVCLWLGSGSAVINRGIILEPGSNGLPGGYYEISQVLFRGAIKAIASAAGATIEVTEGV